MASGGWIGKTIGKVFGGSGGGAPKVEAPKQAAAAAPTEQTGQAEMAADTGTNENKTYKKRGKNSLYVSNIQNGGSGTGLNI